MKQKKKKKEFPTVTHTSTSLQHFTLKRYTTESRPQAALSRNLGHLLIISFPLTSMGEMKVKKKPLPVI